MSSGWFQRALERRVIRELESATGGRVEIADFRFKPWLFQITVHRLVGHGTEPPGSPPLLSVQQADAGISPRQLLHHRLRLRHLDIDGMEVHIRTDRHGVTNLPGPAGKSPAQARLDDLMNLSIGRLTVSHSAWYWNDQQQPLDINAQELAVILHMTQGRYTGSLSSAATTIRSPHWTPEPVNFNSRFELSSDGLVFSPLAWEAHGVRGDATFTVQFRPGVQATGSFHASGDAPALARIFHTPELRGGTIQVEGTGVYQGGSVSARGRAQARQLAIFTPAFPSLPLDVSTSYTLEGRQLDLTNLVVSIFGGTAQGTMQANFQDSPPKFRLNCHVYQMRLDSLLRSPRASMLFASKLHPVSVADGAVGASWAGMGQSLEADFDLHLQGPPTPVPHSLPVSGKARGTLQDGNGLTLHLADAELQTPHSRITARGTIAQRSSQPSAVEPLAFTVSTDDFEEWRPFFESLVAAPAGIPLALKSPAEFSGQLSGSVEEPFLQGRVKSGPFEYHGWAWDRLAAIVALNSGFAQITGGRVDHGRSSFELNATAQLDNWRLTSASRIHAAARAQQTAIEGVEAALDANLPVRGAVSGHLDIEGTVGNLAGTGTARIDQGTLAGEPFEALTAQLQVSRSIWKLEHIELRKKRGQLNGEITVEPKRRFASGQLQGSGIHLADVQRLPIAAARDLSRGKLDGVLNFAAHGGGTVDDFHFQSSWHLENLSVSGTSLGELHGTLTGEGKQLTLQGDGQTPGGDIHFRANTQAQRAWPLVADGRYSNLRADPWIRAFFNREFGAAVSFSGSFPRDWAVAPARANPVSIPCR